MTETSWHSQCRPTPKQDHVQNIQVGVVSLPTYNDLLTVFCSFSAPLETTPRSLQNIHEPVTMLPGEFPLFSKTHKLIGQSLQETAALGILRVSGNRPISAKFTHTIDTFQHCEARHSMMLSVTFIQSLESRQKRSGVHLTYATVDSFSQKSTFSMCMALAV